MRWINKAVLVCALCFLSLPANSITEDTVFEAAKAGDTEKVIEIVERNPLEANARDVQGATPLHKAVAEGHYDTAEALLDLGAKPEPRALVDGTPLHQAPTPELVDLLVERGAHVNSKKAKLYDTPLHTAAWRGDPKVADALLRHGASVNAVNKIGFTPLHYAASRGHTKMAKLLLESGADPGAQDMTGLSVLHWAAGMDRTEIMRMLIDAGADIEAKDRNGWTPLHSAVMMDGNNAVDLLISSGARVNVRDTMYGATPLHWAAGMGKKKIVKALLAAGADPSMKNNEGKTPAKLAREAGRRDIAKLIQRQKKDR